MGTHSSIFAWRIPWTEDVGRLQSTELQRVGHDRATNTFTFHFQGYVGFCHTDGDGGWITLQSEGITAEKV